jgi:hypothetical protein
LSVTEIDMIEGPTEVIPDGIDAVPLVGALMLVRTPTLVLVGIAPAPKFTDPDTVESPASTTERVVDADDGLSTTDSAVPAAKPLISGRSGMSAAAGSTSAAGTGSATTAKFETATVSVLTIFDAVCVTVTVTVALPAEEAV